MFSLLDPVTLGAASCVCTTWYALSQDDSLWQRCLAQVAIASSSSHNRSATRRQQFNAVVSSKAAMLCMHTLCSGFAVASQEALSCIAVVPPAACSFCGSLKHGSKSTAVIRPYVSVSLV